MHRNDYHLLQEKEKIHEEENDGEEEKHEIDEERALIEC